MLDEMLGLFGEAEKSDMPEIAAFNNPVDDNVPEAEDIPVIEDDMPPLPASIPENEAAAAMDDCRGPDPESVPESDVVVETAVCKAPAPVNVPDSEPVPPIAPLMLPPAPAAANETALMALLVPMLAVQSIVKAPAGVAGPSVDIAPEAPFVASLTLNRCVRLVCAVIVAVVELLWPMLSTIHALSAMVVMLTETLAADGVAPAWASTGVVWSTPVSETLPAIAPSTFPGKLTTTLCAPVAGALRYHISLRCVPAALSSERTLVSATPL